MLLKITWLCDLFISFHLSQSFLFHPINPSHGFKSRNSDDLLFEDSTELVNKLHKSNKNFDRLHNFLLDNEFSDYGFLYDLQIECTKSLVLSDTKNRDEAIVNLYRIPQMYLTTFKWTVNLIKIFPSYLEKIVNCKGLDHGYANFLELEKLFNLLMKKEGLNNLNAILKIKPESDILFSTRDIVEMKRKIERFFSEVIIISICCKMNVYSKNSSEILYFIKILIEKSNIHERHFSILLFCRGFVSPLRSLKPRDSSNKLTLSNLVTSDLYPSLFDSFSNGMKLMNLSVTSSTAKLLFPFLLVSLRAIDSIDYLSPSNSTYINDFITKNREFYNLDEASIKACIFVKYCLEYDKDAESMNGLHDFADDLMLSLKRWIVDSISIHFINQDPVNNIVVDDIKKNTVTMELILTKNAFCDEKKLDQEAFYLKMAKIGRCIDLVIKDMINKSESTFQSSSHLNLSMRQKYGKLNMITEMKIIMASYTSYLWLPRSNKLNKKFESLLRFKEISIDKLTNERSNLQKSPSNLFSKPMSKYNIKNIQASPSLSSKSNLECLSSNSVLDESLWESDRPLVNTQTNKINRRNRELISKSDTIRLSNNESNSNEFSKGLVNFLCEAFLESLLVEKEELTLLLESAQFRDHFLYVLSSWRRPHLLFDYLRMHYSSPDIQSIFRRYLKALFAITSENIDDIRRFDPGNARHFEKIPSDIVEVWVTG